MQGDLRIEREEAQTQHRQGEDEELQKGQGPLRAKGKKQGQRQSSKSFHMSEVGE